MRKVRNAQTVTRLQILCTICDDITVGMMSLIQNNLETAETLVSKLKITHKQYHNRISKLIKAGLVRRNCKKYSITSFGKVVYDAYLKMAKAKINLSTLKAIDTIKLNNDIPLDEHRNVINHVIDDYELKNILLASYAKFEK
jgi:predicted transcriptional regulator